MMSDIFYAVVIAIMSLVAYSYGRADQEGEVGRAQLSVAKARLAVAEANQRCFMWRTK